MKTFYRRYCPSEVTEEGTKRIRETLRGTRQRSRMASSKSKIVLCKRRVRSYMSRLAAVVAAASFSCSAEQWCNSEAEVDCDLECDVTQR